MAEAADREGSTCLASASRARNTYGQSSKLMAPAKQHKGAALPAEHRRMTMGGSRPPAVDPVEASG